MHVTASPEGLVKETTESIEEILYRMCHTNNMYGKYDPTEDQIRLNALYQLLQKNRNASGARGYYKPKLEFIDTSSPQT